MALAALVRGEVGCVASPSVWVRAAALERTGRRTRACGRGAQALTGTRISHMHSLVGRRSSLVLAANGPVSLIVYYLLLGPAGAREEVHSR